MTKYSKKLVDRIVKLKMSDSYTVREICSQCGITDTTLYKWKKDKEEFALALEKAEEALYESLAAEAEKSLRKKITGYTVVEKKVTTVPTGKTDESGRPIPEIKEQITTEKHIQPDTAAIIFTLTNRKPGTWSNRQTTELTGKDGKDLFEGKSDEELEDMIRKLSSKIDDEQK